MLKKYPFLSSFAAITVLFAYITGVVWFLNNAERIFGKKPDFPGAILFLGIFVFSAFVSGLLVLGGPIYLYTEKEKKTAVKMLSYNAIFMFLFVILAGLLLYMF
jgi:hypothetical protein